MADTTGPAVTPVEVREEDLERIRYDADGLVPAIVQDADTRAVLMMAWMNAETLRMSLEQGRTVFWSRSRQEVWRKGDTSGHAQYVKSAALDCDADTLLVKVEQVGVACHTGTRTCFDGDPLAVEVRSPDDPAPHGGAR